MLLLSIHDVTPHHEEVLREITASLRELGGLEGRYSMLVVPDFWRTSKLTEHPEFCAWLRDEAKSGVEMLLHGYYHRDEVDHQGAIKAWLARKLTAREGEFFGLSEDEAESRIREGKAMLEFVIDAEVKSFVAPAWLYSQGTRRALRTLGFDIAEDHAHVWSPASGKTLVVGPVLSYASRSEQHIQSSLSWSKWGTRLMKPMPKVRMAIHPGDYGVPALREEIARVIRVLTKKHEAIPYSSLV